MTFLDKLKQEYPEKEIDVNCSSIDCPSTYGYEAAGRCQEGACAMCWNREIPNEGPTCDEVKAAYEQGLNDAWELGRKILSIADKDNRTLLARELNIIYGTNDLMEIFVLTPQEAFAKLKAYEDSKIEVGDVVEADGHYQKMVVTQDRGDKVYCVDSTGQVGCFGKEFVKKTGKHLDISSILEQIGE